MDIINHLQALRQELCDKGNAESYRAEPQIAIHKAITAINNCIEALEQLNNLE